MILYDELRLLHEHLPSPLLKLWGSSDKLVSLSNYLAFGGKMYIQCYKLLEEMQEWSLDRIYEFQFEKLKKLLRHVYDNVPYYREIFDKDCLKPSSIKCLEDLQKLPVITKDNLIANYKKFFARNLWYKRRVYRVTSGTSGKPLQICKDSEHISASSSSKSYFKKSFLGYDNFGKEIMLYSPDVFSVDSFFGSKEENFGSYSPVAKKVAFSGRFANETGFNKYVELIKKFNIKHVQGTPSVFFAFAKYLKNKNENIKINDAILGGEILYGFQRKFIEKQLGCEVFNDYGQAEATILSCECDKHKGMHISPLLGIAEVNGHGLKGKGELIMTNLWNYSWPILRYNIKDIVVLSQKKCTCGCAFPRLMSIKGRENDFVMLPGGNYLNPMSFTCLSVTIKGIKDIFFLQNEDYSLDVSIVKEENADANKIMQAIVQQTEKLVKSKLKIQIRFTDNIERKSRKYRVVETKVPAFLEFKKGI